MAWHRYAALKRLLREDRGLVSMGSPCRCGMGLGWESREINRPFAALRLLRTQNSQPCAEADPAADFSAFWENKCSSATKSRRRLSQQVHKQVLPLINVIGRLKKDWHQQIKSKGITAPRLLKDSGDYLPNPYNGNEEELPSFLKPVGFSFEVLLNLCFSISSDKVINKSDYEIMQPQSHLQSVPWWYCLYSYLFIMEETAVISSSLNVSTPCWEPSLIRQEK